MIPAIGSRVITNNRTGTVVNFSVAPLPGYCMVKFDHRSNADNTYLGTMVPIAEVRPLVIKLVQLPLPLVWERVS